MDAVVSKSPAIIYLERLLSAKFTGFVKWRERGDRGPADELEWTKYTSEMGEREVNEEIYINDFLLTGWVKKDGIRNKKRLSLGNMSSGQKMLLVRLLSILSAAEDGSLILLEEPEMHLDPAWSHQLISLLLLFFKDLNAHLIVATHAYALLNAVPSDCVLVARDGKFSRPDFPTLLASEPAISNDLYRTEPHYVEMEVLRFAEKSESLEVLSQLLNQLGLSSARYDVYERYQLLKRDDNVSSDKQ